MSLTCQRPELARGSIAQSDSVAQERESTIVVVKRNWFAEDLVRHSRTDRENDTLGDRWRR